MAIPVIQSKSEQKEPANTTLTSIAAPSGIVDGDVLVICMATDGDQSTAITWPSGFVSIAEVNNGKACFAGAAYKIASGESGPYAVSWPDAEEAIFEMYRIDGAVAGDEIQDPNESVIGTAETATLTPAVSLDTDDSLVLVIHGLDDDDITEDGGGDADYTLEDVDRSDTGPGTCSIGVQSKGIATAAVPPSCSLTLTAAEQFAAFWFAVRSISTSIPPQTVILDELTLASSLPDLSLDTPVSLPMDELTLDGSIPGITVSAPPPPVSVLLNEITLIGSVEGIMVGVGAVIVQLNVLQLTGSVPGLAVVPGAVWVSMDALQLTGSTPSIMIVPGDILVTMTVLNLAGSAPGLSVLPGVVSVPLSTLLLSGAAEVLTVLPGAVMVAMNTLTLTSNTPVLAVFSEVTLSMSSLILASSTPSLTGVPDTVCPPLDALILGSSTESLNVVSGAVMVSLDALMLVGSTPSLTVAMVEVLFRIFEMAERTIRFKIDARDLIFTMPARADTFKMEDR